MHALGDEHSIHIHTLEITCNRNVRAPVEAENDKWNTVKR